MSVSSANMTLKCACPHWLRQTILANVVVSWNLGIQGISTKIINNFYRIIRNSTVNVNLEDICSGK